MNTNRSLFLSLLASFICLIVSVVCASLLKFNIPSIILLACVVITSVIATVICWRIAVNANKNK